MNRQHLMEIDKRCVGMVGNDVTKFLFIGCSYALPVMFALFRDDVICFTPLFNR